MLTTVYARRLLLDDHVTVGSVTLDIGIFKNALEVHYDP